VSVARSFSTTAAAAAAVAAASNESPVFALRLRRACVSVKWTTGLGCFDCVCSDQISGAASVYIQIS